MQIKFFYFCYLQDFAKVASGEDCRKWSCEAKNAYKLAESEVQQKNEKYKLFGEKTSIILGFILRAAFLRLHECEGSELYRCDCPGGRMDIAAFG